MGTSTASARIGAFCSPYIVYLVSKPGFSFRSIKQFCTLKALPTFLIFGWERDACRVWNHNALSSSTSAGDHSCLIAKGRGKGIRGYHIVFRGNHGGISSYQQRRPAKNWLLNKCQRGGDHVNFIMTQPNSVPIPPPPLRVKQWPVPNIFLLISCHVDVE